jgi:hypothetical protein
VTSPLLCIDLFCGLGGWTEGFLAEGYEVIGFDVEQHIYGEHRYPAQLVLQDVRTLHGRQFRDAAIIVASSPCQEFSYRAMPWSRAKALGPPLLGMELFAQAARIQREACEAAGRYIPMIQENVKGAQKYVGRAQWHYGSYYLWGDVPALMPIPLRGVKVGNLNWSKFGEPDYKGHAFNTHAERATKNAGGSWFSVAHNTTSGHGQNPDGRPLADSVKQHGSGSAWFDTGVASHGSKSSARKAASARIAKIPFPLAHWIARVTRDATQDGAA